MTNMLRATWVIARRDYVATVWSKTFIVFLIAPVLPVLFGFLSAFLTAGSDDGPGRRPIMQVQMSADEASALAKARGHLVARLDRTSIPELRTVARADRDIPVLTGSLDHPRLVGPKEDVRDMGGRIGLLIDTARAENALGRAVPPPVDLETEGYPKRVTNKDRGIVAQGGQFVLFFLTILLAGMMISNMVEEKSNKIIELLAAAVPVDAIFFGKLLAILGASLTGLVAWGAAAGIAAVASGAGNHIPAPAVGWSIFLLLGLFYFMTVFLLWGAIYLAIGAQAGSAREAQTMAMPMSLAQALIFILASSQAAHPEKPIALIAAVIPWASPFAMIARAAVLPALWTHVVALAWQLFALVLTVRVGAGLFRTNILKSGPSKQRTSLRAWLSEMGSQWIP